MASSRRLRSADPGGGERRPAQHRRPHDAVSLGSVGRRVLPRCGRTGRRRPACHPTATGSMALPGCLSIEADRWVLAAGDVLGWLESEGTDDVVCLAVDES